MLSVENSPITRIILKSKSEPRYILELKLIIGQY